MTKLSTRLNGHPTTIYRIASGVGSLLWAGCVTIGTTRHEIRVSPDLASLLDVLNGLASTSQEAIR